MGTPTISAGGILFLRRNAQCLIVIVEREKGIESKWAPVLRQLPKGGCHEGETLEETALREVLEETGFSGRIIGKAGEARWSYERTGRVWDETVHYYFMEPVFLEPQGHDDEFEEIRWIDVEEAARTLSYPEERQLLTDLIVQNQLPRTSPLLLP